VKQTIQLHLGPTLRMLSASDPFLLQAIMASCLGITRHESHFT